MKIGIASDHGGYALKAKVVNYLKKKNFELFDYGTNSKLSVDYPKYAFKLGEDVADNKIDMGILICYTGIGMSIAANKVRGIRCAKVDNVKEAKLARLHNDANIISLNGTQPLYKAKDILDVFLSTNFSNEERHCRRIRMIQDYEDKDPIHRKIERNHDK